MQHETSILWDFIYEPDAGAYRLSAAVEAGYDP